jgi:hypothetical protein
MHLKTFYVTQLYKILTNMIIVTKKSNLLIYNAFFLNLILIILTKIRLFFYILFTFFDIFIFLVDF